MRASTPVFAACIAIATSYVAYPYVTLYRLGAAIHSGNATALQHLVNWHSVREGIKEDLCDAVADDPMATVSKGGLPGFGASFMRGIATNAIDREVTPQGVVNAVRPDNAAPVRGADVQVHWAFFESPTEFQVSLQAPGQSGPITLELELRDLQWQVTRVRLPTQLLIAANQRT